MSLACSQSNNQPCTPKLQDPHMSPESGKAVTKKGFTMEASSCLNSGGTFAPGPLTPQSSPFSTLD